MLSINKNIRTAILLTAAAVALFPSRALAAPTVSWGLFHEKPGEVPIGEASDEYLSKYDAFFHERSGDNRKTLFLTFDTGYDNGVTAKILDVLKEADVPAAFFLTGRCIGDYPDLVKRMAGEGHIVGNHSMNHPNMSQKSAESFASEIQRTEQAYRSVTGLEMPKYYRPPEGVFSEKNLAQAQSMGYKTILWSVCYRDWMVNDQPSYASALKTLTSRVHPGAIVMLHSVSRTSAAVLPEFIAICRGKGYEFKTLDQLG
ncbi:MAG: polysaccharide deacetylase family protein [Firmicutes bacterium]|nr:polysaccharide deacetylase family protein [Bacillota bacterium]